MGSKKFILTWAIVHLSFACAPSGGAPDPIRLDAGVPADAGPSAADSGAQTDAGLESPDADVSAPRCEVGEVARYLDLTYAERPGAPPEQTTLDLAVPYSSPDCPRPPLVVYVHGGGWRSGDKRANAERMAAAFNSEGFASHPH